MIEASEGSRVDPGGRPDAVFQELMAYRVRDILLVSSPYDSYILQEDALLGESLDIEYRQLNLTSTPRITQVSTGAEAIEVLAERPHDLAPEQARLAWLQGRLPVPDPHHFADDGARHLDATARGIPPFDPKDGMQRPAPLDQPLELAAGASHHGSAAEAVGGGDSLPVPGDG